MANGKFNAGAGTDSVNTKSGVSCAETSIPHQARDDCCLNEKRQHRCDGVRTTPIHSIERADTETVALQK